jgi:hypothetical protein
LREFKRKTEARWRSAMFDPNIYGFQFQKGTRWVHGFSNDEIEVYQAVLGVRFPTDFSRLLRSMNGTDLSRVNIYSSSGIAQKTFPGFYSYPRDLATVQYLRERTRQDRAAIEAELLDQGFDLESHENLVLIFGNRYLVCSSDPNKSVVLSIEGTDAIVYAHSLRGYLEHEFLEPWSCGRAPCNI